jgi:putative ABC transport system substrate-binding protein
MEMSGGGSIQGIGPKYRDPQHSGRRDWETGELPHAVAASCGAPGFVFGAGCLGVLATGLLCAARSLKVEPIIAPVHSDAEIETAIIAVGREPGGGLVVMPDLFALAHRAAIILAAARNNLPAVYSLSDFAKDGGLLSYAVDRVNGVRRAAAYVDRILRGAKPAELPVQFATKFEMVVNLKTAKALGLTIPERLLATADQVIE